jgi:hypothetical protein
LGLNPREAFASIKIMAKNDTSNQDQQLAKEPYFMWNRRILGAPFVGGFCLFGL